MAALYEGVRSESSGAADNDQGDVRTVTQLIECKYTGSLERDNRYITQGKEPPRSKLLKDMEKLALEAWSEGRETVLAYREWAPESKLAGSDGWVDFTVRLQHEDVDRDRRLR